MNRLFRVIVILGISLCDNANAELQVRKTNGSLPTADMDELGSGSGVIVGKRFVLTNRHVAQDDQGRAFDGFKIYLGPDFRTGIPAKVVSICDNYDLALLETSETLGDRGKVSLLESLPSLGLRVTAYGFPLGSQFGIGLTATGGQVSRHPVATSNTDDEEQAGIKKAVWHDAVLSSGNSGGPLFSESHVLVGINFAKLAIEDKHALAIPGNIVAEFLRLSGAAGGITFQRDEAKPAVQVDPRDLTVFVEVWGDSTSTGASNKLVDDTFNSLLSGLKKQITNQLPILSDEELSRVQDGELQLLLPEKSAAQIKSGEIARIKGEMTVIQILSDGMLVEIDGVRCAVLLDEGKGAELSAKFGDEVVMDVPMDLAFLVGDARSYTTVVGTTSHAIMLMPVGGLVELPDVKELIASEVSQRESLRAEASAKQIAEEEKRVIDARKKQEQQYLAKLRRTFQDASGKFKIDAAAIAVDHEKVEFLRLSDKRRISVPISKLHAKDREWLQKNRTWIKVYGARLGEIYD